MQGNKKVLKEEEKAVGGDKKVLRIDDQWQAVDKRQCKKMEEVLAMLECANGKKNLWSWN